MSNQTEIVTEFLKGKSIEELLTIISMATAEAKKAVKAIAKAPKEKKTKKGSMPTGSTPPQLYKNNMWVNFVLNHANTNGWPEFIVQGKKETTEIAASVLKDGAHVFEKDNKPFNRKQAMSLSKLYWAPKENTGIKHELYLEFEAQYVAPEPTAAAEATETVKVEEIKEEPKAEKPKKEKKAKAVVAEEKPKEEPKEEKADKPKKEKKAKAEKPKEAKEEPDTFTCENDGTCYPWDWKGKKFLRNFDNQVWERIDAEDSYELGAWAGVYDPKTNKIDPSAEQPTFEDE